MRRLRVIGHGTKRTPRARRIAPVVLVALLSIGGNCPPPAPGSVDRATQCFGMHCCPAGEAVVGLQDARNQLLCAPTQESAQDCFADWATQSSGMHACPPGSYVRGVHTNENVLTCCFDASRGYTPLGRDTVDTRTQRDAMHACPLGQRVRGVHVARNLLLCAEPLVLPPAPPVVFTLDPEQPRGYGARGAMSPDAWRDATRNMLARVLAIPPDAPTPVVPGVSIVEESDLDGTFVTVHRVRMTFPSAVDGTDIPALLYLPPKGSAGSPFPAVLVTHGHGGTMHSSGQDDTSIYAGLARYLAENGFVALAVEMRTFGDFWPPAGPHDHNDFAEWVRPIVMPVLQQSLLGLGRMPQWYVRDTQTALSVLGAWTGVDPSSLAIAGLSLGGWDAMWTSVIDPRITRTLVAGIFTGFACLNHPPDHHDCQTLPALWSRTRASTLLLDTPDIARLLAPRPLYAMWGTGDSFYVQRGVDGSLCRDTARQGAIAAYTGTSAFHTTDIPVMDHRMDDLTALDFLIGRPTAVTRDRSPPSQCNGMHCCPPGHAMVGIENTRNDFLCTRMVDAGTEACSVDRGPGVQRRGMHACPTGSWLRGVHVANNDLTCCHARASGPTLGAEAVDMRTQLQTMHGCPSARRVQSVMTGLQAARNELLCALPNAEQ